jgi:hypothetical protein
MLCPTSARQQQHCQLRLIQIPSIVEHLRLETLSKVVLNKSGGWELLWAAGSRPTQQRQQLNFDSFSTLRFVRPYICLSGSVVQLCQVALPLLPRSRIFDLLARLIIPSSTARSGWRNEEGSV